MYKIGKAGQTASARTRTTDREEMPRWVASVTTVSSRALHGHDGGGCRRRSLITIAIPLQANASCRHEKIALKFIDTFQVRPRSLQTSDERRRCSVP